MDPVLKFEALICLQKKDGGNFYEPHGISPTRQFIWLGTERIINLSIEGRNCVVRITFEEL